MQCDKWKVGEMPQASDELREKMDQRFGDIDDSGPCEFLHSQGYKLGRDWCWTPPESVLSYKDMTDDEYDCLLFLVHEWDYGGLNYGL